MALVTLIMQLLVYPGASDQKNLHHIMKVLYVNPSTIVLFTLFFLISCSDQSNTQTTEEKAKSIQTYSDKNGYFIAIQPSSWKKKDFPEETIRSKIEFVDPKRSDVSIRVIVAPTESVNSSLDELFTQVQDKIRTIIEARFPNIKCAAFKNKVAERDAVVMTCSGSGLEQEIVQYIANDLNYSIALNTASKSDFNSAETTFRSFLDSFTILENGKSLSDADRLSAQIDRLKRLAILHEEIGQLSDALNYTDQGLSLDPTNEELKEMKARLSSKP